MNIEALKNSALKVKELFEKYSEISDEAASAYKQNQVLIDEAISGEIISPTWRRVESGYFTKGEELPEYRDLFVAVAKMDLYLEGFNSENEFEEDARNRMKEARAKLYGSNA
ncbi:MAG: hypothetical protein AB2810_19430 [Candidatus Thiodiazotropha endolucinida]